jgi:hypothetical protein
VVCMLEPAVSPARVSAALWVEAWQAAPHHVLLSVKACMTSLLLKI